MKKKLGILGTGSWGLALSCALSRNNLVELFFTSEKEFKKVSKTRKSTFLPSTTLPKDIKLKNNLDDLNKCKYIFLAMPAQRMRENLDSISKLLKNKIFVICNKGIETETNKLMSQIVLEMLPSSKNIILSGPNFAHEVAQNLPTAFVLSSRDNGLLRELGSIVSTKNFRPYFNNDIIGTQLGGAVKNVIAIACGVAEGKYLGENARSSIITRGLQEIVYLGKKMGANVTTFYGLSGIGDLNLTCNSRKSRNFKLGFKLAQGLNISKIDNMSFLAEGLHSSSSVNKLATNYDIEMPICSAVKDLLSGQSVDKIINKLLSRPLQFEKI